MTLDLRYQTYTDAIPATYLYHSRPAPSEPHHPAPLRIANLACLSAQSCLLYGKGRGYAVSQTKLAILHSSTTLHKVALSAIAVAYQQRYESTGNTGTPLTTVRSPSTSSGFTVQYTLCKVGLAIRYPVRSRYARQLLITALNRCTTGYLCSCYAQLQYQQPRSARKERSTVG